MAARTLLVAFDLDGTLIDSVRDLATAASEVAVTFGGRPLGLHEVSLMVGDGAPVLVRRALAASGVDPDTPEALPRFLEIYARRLLDTTKPYPGVEDMLLQASRRARLAVLTNKPLAPSRTILDGLGLTGYFEEIVGGDNSRGRKPDPANLHALADGASAIALVGDSTIDWATARAAGCPFVWARYGFGAARFETPPETPYVLEGPSAFAGVLDRLLTLHQ